MEEASNIFLDKRQLSLIVLRKESDMIEVYSTLIKAINNEDIKINNVEESNNYHGSWNMAHELFCFLEYNKLKNITKEKKENKELIKRLEFLKESMRKYESPNERTNFKDLQKAIPIIRELVSLSGYHDDTFKDDSMDLTPQY